PLAAVARSVSAAARWSAVKSGAEKSGSGGRATGSGGSTRLSSVPSSRSPSTTPLEAPAPTPASPLPPARPSAAHPRPRAPARRRHAGGRRPGEPHADALAGGTEMLAAPQGHAQHHSARRQRVAGDPVHELAQFRLQRRDVELVRDVLEAIVQAGPDLDVV